MNMGVLKRKYLNYILAIFIGIAVYVVFENLKQKKLNILILSACSLRADRLGIYGGPKTPNLDKVAANSFVFDNAYTDMSWSNVSGFLSRLTEPELRKIGYQGIGRPWTKEELYWQRSPDETAQYYFRTPNPKIFNRGASTIYAEDLNEIKGKILDKSKWPFLLEIHNKVMHFPYGYAMGSSSTIIKNMISAPSMAYMKEYETNIAKYPERLPFGLFFLKSTVMIEEIIRIFKIEKSAAESMRKVKSSLQFIGTLNNKKVMAAWQNSKYFARDLEVIKELYDMRLAAFDNSIKDILNYYDDSEMAENTVVIFTGDHGEAMGEHGYMVHGETVYDEMIRFPLFIRFPGQSSSIRIDDQFYQQSIHDIVKKIMSGELNQANFRDFIKKEAVTPFIFSRNCANDIQSLRYKNEWKFIQNFKTDEKFLYNLKTDPKELTNVFDNSPDTAMFLSEKISEVSASQTKNKMIHECTEFNN